MKKLLGLLFTTAFIATAMTGCGKKDVIYYVDLDPLKGDESDLYKEVHGKINGQVDYQETKGSVIESRSHGKDIMAIIEYTEEYMEDYTLEELIQLPTGVDMSDVTAANIDDVIMTSRGGPVYADDGSYFDSPWQVVYRGTTDSSKFGKAAQGGQWTNNEGILQEGAMPGDWNYWPTTYVDSNKTWAEQGIPMGSDQADEKPEADHLYNAWFTYNPNTEWFPTDYVSSQINVAILQSQHVHYDEINAITENRRMTMDEMTEYSLRSIGIMDAAATMMAEEYPEANLSFLSHSYGGLIAPMYLTTMGSVDEIVPSRDFKFDKFIITASRLNWEEEVADTLGNGRNGQYKNSGGKYHYFAIPESEFVNGLKNEWQNYENKYNAMSQVEQEAYDAVISDHFGGMSQDHYINRWRATMTLTGHIAAINFVEILETYGGSQVKDHAYFVHGGKDENTGPLTEDEVAAINEHFKGNVYDSQMGHNINHFYDFTRSDGFWGMFDPTNAYVKLGNFPDNA